MKRIITVIFLTIINYFVFTQSLPQVKWGEPIKENNLIILEDIIGTDGVNTYTLKFDSRTNSSYIIERLDKNLNLIISQKLKLKYGGKAMEYEYITYKGNELMLFSSMKNNSTKKKTLFVQHIDRETLISKGDFKKVSELDYKGYSSRWNSGYFGFINSRDGSKLLIYYGLPYDDKSKEKFGFHVFDQNNKQLWEKDVTLPELDDKYYVKDFSVDNEGNVQAVGVIYTGEKKMAKRDLTQEHSLEVLNFTDQGSKMIRYPVSLIDKYITDITISVNNEKDILCGGFYSNKGSYSIAGTFFMKIDNISKKVLQSSFKPFEIGFITGELTERQEGKVNKQITKGINPELYEYDLHKMMLTLDGGIVLIGEQCYTRHVPHSRKDANGNTITTTTYHSYYNDIIVVSINPNGEIVWTNKIEKHQHTIDGGLYSSYHVSVLEKEGLKFIFNNKQVLSMKGTTVFRSVSKNEPGEVVLVTIDRSGKQTHEALLQTEYDDVVIMPKVSEQINSNETFIFGKRKKVSKYGRVIFE